MPRAVAVVASLLALSAFADVPLKFAYQGRLLTASGAPAEGMVTVSFALYDAPTGGNQLWSESQNLALTDGFYATVLGDAAQIPAKLLDGSERYLELSIGGSGPLSPRQRIDSVPYAVAAMNAQHAATADAAASLTGPLAGDVTGAQGATAVGALQGTPLSAAHPGDGQVLKYDASSGTWRPGPDAVNPGTVTGVTVASPLTVANATTTPAFGLVPSSAGQFLRDDGSAGWKAGGVLVTDLPKAGGDLGGTLAAATVSGVQGVPVSATAPGDGQVLKYSAAASQWVAAPDLVNPGTVTSVSVKAPLTIASPSTTPTIALAPSAAHQVLRDDGSGGWTAGGLALGDLPSGGAATITAGAGLSGGGSVAPGGSITLTNAGVLSLAGGGGVSASASSGAVTLSTRAGGDLSGSLSGATVLGLQGVQVSAAAPGNGQVLKYDASSGQWQPAADAVNPGTVTSVVANAPLTLTNATTTPTLSLGVVGLANGGTGVTAAPAANQFLRGDGSGKWTAGAITASDLPTLSGGYVDLSSSQAISGTKTFASPIAGSVTGSAASFTGNLAGDVTGAQGSTLVAALRGRPLSTATPNGGDVLAFASGQWAPSSGGLSVNTGAGLSGGGSVPLGGSLTLTNTGVTSLAAGGGVTITATSGAITLGTSAGGDLSGTLAGATVAKLQGVNVASGTPASGQVLAYDGSKWAPTTPAATGVTSVSAGAGLAGGTITGAGTLSIGAGAVTNAMLASPYATLNTSGGLTGGGTLNLGGALTLGLASQGGDLSGAYGSTKVVALQGVGVGTALPSSGQVLTYDGSKWAPAAAPATGVTSVSAGAGLAGGTITVAGTLSIGAAAVTNAMLQSSSLTVTAGTGLSGGGAVALGGSVSVANTGILALTGSANIAVTSGQSPTLSLTGTIPVGNLPPLGGDVTGAPNAATVARLQGVNVATAAPAAGQVLAYDGTAGQWTPSTNSSAVLTTRKYYVVLIVRSASDCPSGYNAESLANLKGADNNFYSFISGAGLYLGGNAISYGQEYLYWRVNSTSVPATETICWFAYDTRGKPMTSVLLYGSAQTCPSGYYGIPTSHLNGNNGYGYLLSNANGMYLGYVDSWDYGGQTSRDGYAYRYWYSTYLNPGGSDGTACFKVMGVEQDPATRNGVFPVSLGVKGPSACPSGYTYLASTALANSAQANTYTYSQFTDALTSFGGLYTWGGSGENYMYEYWTWNENINYCFKFYPLTGKPYATVRALNGQSCPDATYLSVNVSDVNGWNANAYLQKTPYALYLGGLEGWTEQSYNEGYFTANITTNTNKLCYRLDNVSSWP